MHHATPSTIRKAVTSSRAAAIERALALGIPMTGILVATAAGELKEKLDSIPTVEAITKQAADSIAAMAAQREDVLAMARRNRALYVSRIKAMRERLDKALNEIVRLNIVNRKLREENAALRTDLDKLAAFMDD